MRSTGKFAFFRPSEHRLNRKTVVFLACLGLSTLFWLLTSLSKDYVEVIRIPLKYRNLPENMLVVNELTSEVNAEVKIFGFDLLWYWLRLDKVELTIDASPAKLRKTSRGGKAIYFVLMNERKSSISAALEEQFQLIDLSPDTLFIRLAPLFSKKVPVRLDAEISFKRQYGAIDRTHLEPDSILIIGLRELIDTIISVRTEHTQWNDLSESVTTDLPLQQPYDDRLVRYSNNNVEIELNVVEFTEGKVTVPIHVIASDAEKVKVFPQQVDVTYQVPLAAYESIGPEQFHVSVRTGDAEQKGLSRLTVKVDAQPEHVRQLRISPPQVEFIIRK